MKFLLLLAVCLNCKTDGRMDLVTKEYSTRAKCESAAAKIKRDNPNYRSHLCLERKHPI